MNNFLTVHLYDLQGHQVPAVQISPNHIAWAQQGRFEIKPLVDMSAKRVGRLFPIDIDYRGVQHDRPSSPTDVLTLNAEMMSLMPPMREVVTPIMVVCRILRAFGMGPADWSIKGLFTDYDTTQWLYVEG